MGNQLCCSATNRINCSTTHSSAWDANFKKNIRQRQFLKAYRSQRNDYHEELTDDRPSPHEAQALKPQCKLKFVEAFSVSIGDDPVRFLSFSQRKFAGFRNQFEYDRKRLLIASTSSFCIIGYDLDENPQELINTSVSDNEEIKSISFIDDERPQFVLLVTKNKSEPQMFARLLKIKKEQDKAFAVVDKVIENQQQIENIVLQSIAAGQTKKPRTYYDNYNVQLKKDIKVKKEEIQHYHKDSEKRKARDDSTNSITTATVNTHNETDQQVENASVTRQEEKYDLAGTDSNEDLLIEPEIAQVETILYEATGDDQTIKLPIPKSSAASSFIDKSMVTHVEPVYKVYEIQEQVINTLDTVDDTHFDKVFYYNYSQYKKLLFCTTPKNVFTSFLINHRLHDSKENTSHMSQNKQGTLSSLNIRGISVREPILINTHNTQYYGKNLESNFQYKKVQLEAKIRQSDFASETLFVIYEEPCFNLDLIQVNGQINKRYNIEDCFKENGLSLIRLSFVQVPALKWSTRAFNLQNFGNSGDRTGSHIKRLILAGEVFYQLRLKTFLMLFNLESSQAETIKILDIESRVSCINYGPYDNGHLMVGCKDGSLLAFDFPTLERLESVQIFEQQAVTSITFDPTNYVFVGGEKGKVVSLSYIDKKMHYLYLDMGNSKYCTVQVPRILSTRAENQNKRIGYDHLEGSNYLCCV